MNKKVSGTFGTVHIGGYASFTLYFQEGDTFNLVLSGPFKQTTITFDTETLDVLKVVEIPQKKKMWDILQSVPPKVVCARSTEFQITNEGHYLVRTVTDGMPSDPAEMHVSPGNYHKDTRDLYAALSVAVRICAKTNPRAVTEISRRLAARAARQQQPVHSH